ncbi:2-oxoglutarate (2OG) and Fe(II)-dependent oxygenase superfamily protein [Euphorbia peplus]|nr:2-oxoglutarate (2OG) and Fe(II)-dependent oxygenase superfamily protein [Euphorbia peplus]
MDRLPIVELLGQKRNSSCQEVREAFEKYGCFELVYNKHNIEFHNSILEAIEEFFSLSDEIKTKNIPSDIGQPFGYSAKSPVLPITESARIENATNKQQCQNFTRLLWPNGNQHFSETVHSYSMLLAEIHEVIMKMLCESYGIEKEYIESHLKSTSYLTSFNKYERSNQADTNLGFMGHTDKSFLTIIHQNHVKGLEIKLKDGDDRWSFYEPSSYFSFIVFAGDACMGWSNDRIKSPYHRVMVEGEEVRYSVGSFSFVTGLIEAPKELIDEEHPLKYKPFDQREFLVACNNFKTDANKCEITALHSFCGI